MLFTKITRQLNGHQHNGKKVSKTGSSHFGVKWFRSCIPGIRLCVNNLQLDICFNNLIYYIYTCISSTTDLPLAASAFRMSGGIIITIANINWVLMVFCLILNFWCFKIAACIMNHFQLIMNNCKTRKPVSKNTRNFRGGTCPVGSDAKGDLHKYFGYKILLF